MRREKKRFAMQKSTSVLRQTPPLIVTRTILETTLGRPFEFDLRKHDEWIWICRKYRCFALLFHFLLLIDQLYGRSIEDADRRLIIVDRADGSERVAVLLRWQLIRLVIIDQGKLKKLLPTSWEWQISFPLLTLKILFRYCQWLEQEGSVNNFLAD